MGKKDIEKFQVQKGQVLNPKGRPPKLISSVINQLKEEGYEPATPTLIKQASEYLITLDKGKLEELAEDDMQPMYLQILARELLGDKGEEVMNRMIDRAYGKPKQGVEHSGEGGGAIVFDFSPKIIQGNKPLATDEKQLD